MELSTKVIEAFPQLKLPSLMIKNPEEKVEESSGGGITGPGVGLTGSLLQDDIPKTTNQRKKSENREFDLLISVK